MTYQFKITVPSHFVENEFDSNGKFIREPDIQNFYDSLGIGPAQIIENTNSTHTFVVATPNEDVANQLKSWWTTTKYSTITDIIYEIVQVN
jgi:hypothetical protein